MDPQCASWSPMSTAMNWFSAVSPGEATNGGCDNYCDDEPNENYCEDLSLGGLSWRLPTIAEIEDLAVRNPPFENPDGDLWSVTSDNMDQMAWTANIEQPGMSVLLQKDATANVRCIAD